MRLISQMRKTNNTVTRKIRVFIQQEKKK
jgi:hypothetical protein